ncbi:MAG TPA: DUF1569 domain-containing protein [Planctomycetaceae bacterium]|nr:DUF1569 domain-containing protein [Planctomycetaceae bacterium]
MHEDRSANAAPAADSRREVEYRTLAAFLQDAEFLATHPHKTVGNWSYGKILQHLTDGLNRSFDGFPFRVNPLVRWVVRTFMKKKLLTQPMSAGFKLPKKWEAELPPDSTPVDEALERLKQAIARFEREAPRADHPALGPLTPEEWVQLHLRHAALHMSFVKPV